MQVRVLPGVLGDRCGRAPWWSVISRLGPLRATPLGVSGRYSLIRQKCRASCLLHRGTSQTHARNGRQRSSVIRDELLSRGNSVVKLQTMYASVPETARQLNVSPQCVRTNYLKTGQLQGEFIAGRWLIPLAEIERFKKIERPAGVSLEQRSNGRRSPKRNGRRK